MPLARLLLLFFDEGVCDINSLCWYFTSWSVCRLDGQVMMNRINILLSNLLYDKFEQLVMQLIYNYIYSILSLSIYEKPVHRMDENLLGLAFCEVYLENLRKLRKTQGTGSKSGC